MENELLDYAGLDNLDSIAIEYEEAKSLASTR